MNRRRLVIVGVLLALGLVVAGVAAGRVAPPATASFAQLGQPTTPFVPLSPDRLTSSFHCPGVPGAGEDSGGSVLVVNPTEAALGGEVTSYGSGGVIASTPFEIASRTSQTFDLGAGATEGFVAALVEVAGAGAVVQQQARLDGRTSVAACANDASTEWTVAAGSTLGDRYQLVLSNPYADAAVVDIDFITAAATRSPNEFQNFVVPSRTVRVVEIDQVARDEAQLSLQVTSRRGRLVAGRAWRAEGGGRNGATVALASAGGARQWLFADGELADGVEDIYTVVNVGAQPASVDLTMFPAQPPTDSVIPPITLEIASGRSVVVDPTSLAPGFSGRYGMSVAAAGDGLIVVEHTVTRPDTGSSVALGARFGSGRWWMAQGVPEPLTGALVVFNASGAAGTLTVSTLGPGGAQALPALEDIAVAGAATLTFDLPPEAVGLPVVVTATGDLNLVVVQAPPAGDSLRSSALAVPE